MALRGDRAQKPKAPKTDRELIYIFCYSLFRIETRRNKAIVLIAFIISPIQFRCTAVKYEQIRCNIGLKRRAQKGKHSPQTDLVGIKLI